MASSAKRTSSSNKGAARSSARKKKEEEARAAQDSALFHEIGLIVLFIAMLILFCCNFGIIGPVGNTVSGVLFGIFGLLAYAVPILVFFAAAFWFANEGNPNAVRKLVSGVVLCIMLGVLCDLLTKTAGSLTAYNVKALYVGCRDNRTGGGVLAGSLSYFLQHYLETLGTVLVVVLCSAVSLILLTEKSLISSVKKGGSRVRELSREDAARRREHNRIRREEQEELRARREEERRLKAEEKENEKILRMEKKVSGVMLDTALTRPEADRHRDDVHEIVFNEEQEDGFQEEMSVQEMPAQEVPVQEQPVAPIFDFDKIRVRTMHQVRINDDEMSGEGPDGFYQDEPAEMNLSQNRTWGTVPEPEAWAAEQEIREAGTEPEDWGPEAGFADTEPGAWAEEPEMGILTDTAAGPVMPEQSIRIHKEDIDEPAAEPLKQRPAAGLSGTDRAAASEAQKSAAQPKPLRQAPKKYMFPPISCLQKSMAAANDTTQELKETAMRLQQTLSTFGVNVTITDISQGPSVTRYELQPEQGVKVSKIVGLADDIKLNLAATDIRIEAPIPGKAAIGIEVPNKETMPVALRDLLESKEFKEFQSNIAFAVGKDIAGKVVVTDIAKMPHMLIAGATGSGKSVCINTLIMSILYKAHPDDVKLIMVDPKVVELSVYNGIPHLLIPVVTDPKKASAALHWGVSEMEDRYRKFADLNVRDLKGYNKKIESQQKNGQEDAPAKMPQIVIIVDELADLMMVCPGEVEESICRLAQLARAAGIHLIIATQRPSVDVITGLIKANMPSRVAFSVSSGVDSRTILDMNGAEKLLGKGDMLFYPQGYSKPARVQGAFVSDREVSDVVDFLKNQALGNTYASDIEEKIKNIGSGGSGASEGADELDELFERAGRFIIEKDKASIGMLQRALKIGFNRAARIMDQLCEFGVVGEEEGTKPRKILMGPEQFEQLLEERV